MIGKLGQQQVTRPNDKALQILIEYLKIPFRTPILKPDFITNWVKLALPHLDTAKLTKQIHHKLDKMAPSPHLSSYKRDIARTAGYLTG